jgi:hypothetical protein
LLVKPTFPFFVAGAIVVVLVRGGWRERRGLALFVLTAAVVGAPWYLRHLGELGQTLSYATQPPRPPRFSLINATFFGWNQLNGQLFLPLCVFVAAGTVFSARRWRGGVDRDDHTPELLVGGLIAYLGLTYGMTLHAPYYSLPALPYEALLGTLWIASLKARIRHIATAGLGAVATLNVIAVGIHSLGDAHFDLPGRPPTGFIAARQVTIWRSFSWPVGPPRGDGRLLGIFQGLRARGIRQVEVHAGLDQPDFDVTGIVLLARIAGLSRPTRYAPQALGPDAVFVDRATMPTPWPPCRHLTDGSSVLVLRRHRGGPYGWASACPAF